MGGCDKIDERNVMRGKLLWITGAAIVLVLSVASVAFAATQDRSTNAPVPQARAPPPAPC